MGNHLDNAMKERIINGDYIDFGKLLPKDRVLAEEDERLELIIKQGRTFWSPVSESVTINLYSRWEQAFRIYSDIYTRQHPHRSPKLIQYNHVIHSIATTYTWDNVYAYDREFCIHLSKHPERSWAMILQQAWSMKLKDRIYKSDQYAGSSSSSGVTAKTFQNGNNNNHTPNGKGGKANKPCQRFNKGFCKFGTGCRFEHRCSYCFKFGHSVLHCRKLIIDREKAQKSKDTKDGRDPA